MKHQRVCLNSFNRVESYLKVREIVIDEFWGSLLAENHWRYNYDRDTFQLAGGFSSSCGSLSHKSVLLPDNEAKTELNVVRSY